MPVGRLIGIDVELVIIVESSRQSGAWGLFVCEQLGEGFFAFGLTLPGAGGV